MRTDNAMIRPCGSDYKYCNGNCATCTINNIYTTNTTRNTQQAITYRANSFDDYSSRPTEAVFHTRTDKQISASRMYHCESCHVDWETTNYGTVGLKLKFCG